MKILIPCLLPCIVSDEEFAVMLKLFVYVYYLFSLAAFKIFSLLFSATLIIMCFGRFFVIIILLGFYYASYTCGSIVFIRSGKLSTIFFPSEIFVCPPQLS